MSTPHGASRYAADGVPAQPSGRTEAPIALVGPSGGGKTTFLLAVLHGGPETDVYGEWRATPPEDASALVDALHDAIDEQRFPEATVSRTSEYWTIRGEYPEQVKRGVLGRTTLSPGEKVEFDLMIVDPPGGDFLDPRNTGIIDVLTSVEGLILLIDPTKMMTEAAAPQTSADSVRVPTYKYLNRLFRTLDSRLLRTGAAADGWLPHRVSVCVSKFDHPAVYQRAKQLALVDAQSGRQPVVATGDGARTLFEDLCRTSVETNDAGIPELLARYFHRDRISYHVISAIGFFVDPQGGFHEGDLGNVAVRGGEHYIRRLQPAGVWEALIDLFEAIRPGRLS